jgi:transcriptional regulator with XRE-family HTH domain
MNTIRPTRCPQCGAWQRHTRRRGDLCRTCVEIGPEPRSALPPDFYDREPVVAALRNYDFGSFFLLVRELTAWSQLALGGVVGLDQSRVSAIERGVDRLRDVELVIGVAQGLQIPPARLNFPDVRATVGTADVAVRKDVSWVDRRDFGQHIAKLVLGIAGAAGLDLDRLAALLPQPEPSGARRIGAADVEVIEHVTAAFRRQDHSHGSGLIRDSAIAQLRSVLPLLDAQVNPEVRPRLLMATADLATQAGWMSCTVKQHDVARRLWMIALDLARDADHPRSTDLTVYLLADMALQAVRLDRPEEALHLVRVAHTATVGTYPVSASTSSLLMNIEAQAHAAQRNAKACDRALGQATEHFGTIEPAAAPPWTAYLYETGVSGGQGAACYKLAMANDDQRAAARAVSLLRQAVDRYGPGYARLRAVYLPDLAGAHALAGDVDTAVTVGHDAVNAATVVSSSQGYDGLRTLHTVLEPLHTSPGIAELRERLVTTAAA